MTASIITIISKASLNCLFCAWSRLRHISLYTTSKTCSIRQHLNHASTVLTIITAYMWREININENMHYCMHGWNVIQNNIHCIIVWNAALYHEYSHIKGTTSRPWHIMFKIWAIMLCSYAQRITPLCFQVLVIMLTFNLCSYKLTFDLVEWSIRWGNVQIVGATWTEFKEMVTKFQ